MDHTFVDEKSLKSLDDYAVMLTANLITLLTLQNIQVRALEIGILSPALNERANTLIWDIRRLLNLYQTQLNEVLELLPDDFDGKEIISKLKDKELGRARSMLRKKKEPNE